MTLFQCKRYLCSFCSDLFDGHLLVEKEKKLNFALIYFL